MRRTKFMAILLLMGIAVFLPGCSMGNYGKLRLQPSVQGSMTPEELFRTWKSGGAGRERRKCSRYVIPAEAGIQNWS